MIRPPIALVILAALAGGALFQIAFQVSALEDDLALLNREITSERDSMHVLRAEWTHLNQPERLADLSVRYLDMEPVTTALVGGLDIVPPRLAETILNAAGGGDGSLLPRPRLKPISPPQFAARRRSPNVVQPPSASPSENTFDDLLVQILQPGPGGT